MFGYWPACKPPRSLYENEEYQYRAKDPDMIFDATWDNDTWCCFAEGYGGSHYGNGGIAVYGFDGVEKVE